MKLHDILKEIKQVFEVDESLRAYLYSNKILLIDYTSEVDIDDDHKLDAFYGRLGTIYLNENNEIKTIENECINLITPVNKDSLIHLCNLIGIQIEDYNDFPKLPNIKQINLYEEI